MFQQDHDKSLSDYRELEACLHREFLHCSRKYLNKLGIVSVIGILDIVKQEIIELEKATKKPVDSPEDKIEIKETDDF